MKKHNLPISYKSLVEDVVGIVEQYRTEALRLLRQMLVNMYWEIGKYIALYLQKEEQRAVYGKKVLAQLSKDLTALGERGFSVENLRNMRHFYLTYPDSEMLRAGITWTHYQRLMRLDCTNTRRFYEEMIIREKWSVRELERQIQSFLYERTLTHKKEQSVVAEARKGRLPAPVVEEEIKDPYILDFLQLTDGQYQENDLEEAIISHLERFLLELGYGFTFAWRQKRIQIGDQFYYIDLVFFHRGLKCLVLLDLKIGKFTYANVGQMNMYLNYFRENERYEGENDPVGIILCADKDEETVRYALDHIDQNIFVSRYRTMLPSEELLRKKLIEEKQRYFHSHKAQSRIRESSHPRKEKILQYLKQSPRVTVQDYIRFAEISRATAQRDLSQAVGEGWLTRHGRTRSVYYTLAELD